MKERLDVLLVKQNLAPSREKAKAMIMAGSVLVDGQREDKAGSMFPDTVKLTIKGHTLPYVSRGGLKLEKAMTHFDLSLDGKVCMDVGASTGGFTDCMLQNGAVKVYSVDVGHGQLDWKLRNDPRVVCMERTNIRYVTPEDLEEKAEFVFIDVSFISLTKVLPAGAGTDGRRRRDGFLIKPQFEAGREKSREKKGLCGIRRTQGSDREGSRFCPRSFLWRAASGIFPDQGTGEILEYLLHLRKQEEGQGEVDIRGVVQQAHRDLDR